MANIVASCSNDNSGNINEIIDYTGPIRELTNAEILHSDSAVIKAKVITPSLLEFEDGNQEMPSGFFIEFFSADGSTSSTLTADYARYNKEEDRWKATGNVILVNIKNNERLNTEELFWNPTDEKIYTEKFVRIETEDQILLGQGLTADQDFSTYKIEKLTGELTIDDQDN